ncbi:hypothetical protein K0U83_17465 [bacterium]|nr:hypothetical protein [bacterium]
MIAVELPGLRLSSTLNSRTHWRVRSRLAKAARFLTRMKLEFYPRPTRPVVVTMTRVSPGQLDSDNLAGACKSVRDGVADWMGVDDGQAERDGRVTWVCRQERGKYGVRIVVEEVAT